MRHTRLPPGHAPPYRPFRRPATHRKAHRKGSTCKTSDLSDVAVKGLEHVIRLGVSLVDILVSSVEILILERDQHGPGLHEQVCRVSIWYIAALAKHDETTRID